jgi:hypothetical protein
MIHYTLSLSNIFYHHSKWNKTYSQKKQVMLYNTFNIRENATLPFLIPKYMFFVKGSFSNYVILIIKNTFKH